MNLRESSTDILRSNISVVSYCESQLLKLELTNIEWSM